jgi:hypothetical protein
MQATHTQSPPARSGVPAPRTLLGLDRFTLGIGITVAILVPLLFLLVFSQPKATPMEESNPAGVAHNYYLAVQQDDLSKAYGYLSVETRGWLSYEQFTAQVSSRPETRSVRIQDERIEGDTARVTIGLTLYMPTGPFSSGEVSQQRSLVLRREGDVWRIALPRSPAISPYGPYNPDLYGW